MGPRVLVFLKGGIGDVVFALPLIADLAAGLPGARLVALSHAQGADVLRACPLLHEVREAGVLGAPLPPAEGVAALAGERFDVALTPVRSVRAAWLLVRSGARERVGFAGGPERLLFTRVAPVRPFEVVFARRFERLAEALGLPTGAPGAELVVGPEARAAARERLRSAGWREERSLVTLHVGGGWPTKQWPVEHLRGVVQALAGRGVQCLLIGGAADAGRAAEASAGLEATTIVRTGTSVAHALHEMALSRAAVGVDSGLSHAGVALGLPTVLLFGPNDPASVPPSARTRLLVQSLACRPCNRAGKRGCPEGHHRCMRDTTPEHVLAALQALAPALAG